ncbi:MAG TPA: hypothetical protein VHC90_25560 [Bryobacteraceae bacterium]|nr:hypothetical protein [Bryobacteraceae bacterium]
MRRLNLLSAVAGLLFCFAAAQPAHAGMAVNIYNDGSGNVIATADGTIDLTGLTYLEGSGQVDLVAGNDAGLVTGAFAGFSIYIGLSGPSVWGPGETVDATSGTGDIFGIVGAAGGLALPENYVSGVTLNSEAVFSDTIDSLGLNPGTYTYNWGTGADADSLVVNISETAPSSAPEPSTGVLGIAGICAVTAFFRMRTKSASRTR